MSAARLLLASTPGSLSGVEARLLHAVSMCMLQMFIAFVQGIRLSDAIHCLARIAKQFLVRLEI